jgi:hypothetical protein
MWDFRCERLPNSRGLRFNIVRDSHAASFNDILNAWQNEAEFCSHFNSQLAASPFGAFRWETPSVTTATANRPFEFVLLDSPSLARSADQEAFADQFRTASKSGEKAEIAVFQNLGGDAILVVPLPRSSPSVYVHLATFVREAPASQQVALWQSVGEAMANRISSKPVWLSTAGAGVAWLHVRLDDRPKYYGYAEFRR